MQWPNYTLYMYPMKLIMTHYCMYIRNVSYPFRAVVPLFIFFCDNKS